MTAQQQLDLDRLERASKFGKENAIFFTPKSAKLGPSKGQQILAELDSIILRISTAYVIQVSGGVGAETEDKGALREILQETMGNISKSVAYIAADRKEPAIQSRFRMPRDHNDKTLTAHASAFCEAINELNLENELIALDHEPDFLKRLQSLILEFKIAQEAQSGALQEQVGATAVFVPYISRGKVLVKGLDAIVQNKFKDNPAKLGAWRTAIHAKQTARRRPKLPAPATPA
ncbi:MAG: hypothetical protein JWL59_2176 [Chthoniobacteraceae bacterium]|nr:hypothetical protein [Chthoniobacteraceae bacterium]